MICQGDNHTAFTNALYYFKIHPLEICQTLQAYTRVGKQTSCLVYSNLFLLVHVVSLTPYDVTDCDTIRRHWLWHHTTSLIETARAGCSTDTRLKHNTLWQHVYFAIENNALHAFAPLGHQHRRRTHYVLEHGFLSCTASQPLPNAGAEKSPMLCTVLVHKSLCAKYCHETSWLHITSLKLHSFVN